MLLLTIINKIAIVNLGSKIIIKMKCLKRIEIPRKKERKKDVMRGPAESNITGEK